MTAPLPDNEEERLKALLGYRVLDTDFEEAYDELTELASHICDTPIALISLIDADRQWFKSAVGLSARQTPRDQAFCAHAILQREVMMVPDATQDVRFADNPLVTSDPNIRFYAGAPLVSDNGLALGTLCAIDHRPRVLDESQIQALQTLAKQVMTQLELRLVVEQLQGATRDLQTTNQSKDRLFSIISHDLRAPFNGILGFTELLSTNASIFSEDELKEVAGQVHATARRTLGLVDDLLQWSRLELGNIPCERDRLPLSGMVQEVFEIVGSNAEQKGITMRSQTDSRAVVYADYGMIRSLMMNLVTNAVKFTPADGEVTVRLETDADTVRLQIVDTGVGMTPEQLHSVMEIGYNKSQPGTAGEIGSGLGIMLCQQFAEKNDATLTAESTLGVGTTFTLTMARID